MEFKRPEGSLYPIIYSSFKAKLKNSDEVEEYFVQDLTEEYFDRAVDFIVENHAKGAVYHKASKTLDGDSGIQLVREMYSNVFKEKISLICFKLGSKEIAGLNALCIKTRDNFIAPGVMCEAISFFKLLIRDFLNFSQPTMKVLIFFMKQQIMSIEKPML